MLVEIQDVYIASLHILFYVLEHCNF